MRFVVEADESFFREMKLSLGLGLCKSERKGGEKGGGKSTNDRKKGKKEIQFQVHERHRVYTGGI